MTPRPHGSKSSKGDGPSGSVGEGWTIYVCPVCGDTASGVRWNERNARCAGFEKPHNPAMMAPRRVAPVGGAGEELERITAERDRLQRIVDGVTSKTALDVVAEKMAAEDELRKVKAAGESGVRREWTLRRLHHNTTSMVADGPQLGPDEKVRVVEGAASVGEGDEDG